MHNRIEFFESISGITDPRLVIIFYDQFLAMYNIIGYRDDINISVDNYSDTAIRFSVLFNTANDKKESLTQLPSGTNIYGRPISVFSQDIAVKQIAVDLLK